jgi:hypothetical protein
MSLRKANKRTGREIPSAERLDKIGPNSGARLDKIGPNSAETELSKLASPAESV